MRPFICGFLEIPGVVVENADDTGNTPLADCILVGTDGMENSDMKILLVDDNLAVRKIARLFLVGAGFTVEVADHADDALQILSTDSFDVLITDMIMPGALTGIDLILHAQAYYPKMKCGLISGMSDTLVDKSMDSLKDLQTLSKPFSKTDIVDFVKQMGT